MFTLTLQGTVLADQNAGRVPASILSISRPCTGEPLVIGRIFFRELPDNLCENAPLRPRISRHHFTIDYEPGPTCIVTDCSAGGTYINGQLLGKGRKVALKDGDMIGVLMNPKNPTELQLGYSFRLSKIAPSSGATAPYPQRAAPGDTFAYGTFSDGPVEQKNPLPAKITLQLSQPKLFDWALQSAELTGKSPSVEVKAHPVETPQTQVASIMPIQAHQPQQTNPVPPIQTPPNHTQTHQQQHSLPTTSYTQYQTSQQQQPHPYQQPQFAQQQQQHVQPQQQQQQQPMQQYQPPQAQIQSHQLQPQQQQQQQPQYWPPQQQQQQQPQYAPQPVQQYQQQQQQQQWPSHPYQPPQQQQPWYQPPPQQNPANWPQSWPNKPQMVQQQQQQPNVYGQHDMAMQQQNPQMIQPATQILQPAPPMQQYAFLSPTPAFPQPQQQFRTPYAQSAPMVIPSYAPPTVHTPQIYPGMPVTTSIAQWGPVSVMPQLYPWVHYTPLVPVHAPQMTPLPVQITSQPMMRPGSVSSYPTMDDDPTQTCTLFVAGLDYSASENDIIQSFGRVGKVSRVIIKYEPSGKSRGFCFVTMASRAEAERAIKAMDKAQIKSRTISVQWSRRSVGGPPDPTQLDQTPTPTWTPIQTPTEMPALEPLSPASSANTQNVARRTLESQSTSQDESKGTTAAQSLSEMTLEPLSPTSSVHTQNVAHHHSPPAENLPNHQQQSGLDGSTPGQQLNLSDMEIQNTNNNNSNNRTPATSVKVEQGEDDPHHKTLNKTAADPNTSANTEMLDEETREVEGTRADEAEVTIEQGEAHHSNGTGNGVGPSANGGVEEGVEGEGQNQQNGTTKILSTSGENAVVPAVQTSQTAFDVNDGVVESRPEVKSYEPMRGDSTSHRFKPY